MTAERTRRLRTPWPFLWSVVPRRGLVVNLPPPKPRPRRLKRLPPANLWQQPTLEGFEP